MNDYFKSAQTFLKLYNSFLIDKKLTNESTIQCILFFTIGIEHLLKSILYKINPVYVLVDETFMNSALICYEDDMKYETKK